MKKGIDCEVFQDQLGALEDGPLPEEGIEQLRLHAGSCAVCAMLLRMHEHLVVRSQADLEAAVPDELVASMWPRVQAEIATQQTLRLRESRSRRAWSWLVPTMAAATILLFIGTGFLFAELSKLRERERLLVQQVVEQRRWLAELDQRTSASAIARTAGLAGSATWERVLSRRERLSLSELSDLLASVPSGTTILGAIDLEELAGNTPLWRTAAWRELLDGIETEDGVQAGELLRLIQAMDVDPRMSISTARLLRISRRALGRGRS